MVCSRPFAGLTLALSLWGGTALAAAPALSDANIARIENALKTAPDQGFGPDAFGLARAEAQLADPARREAGKAALAEATIAYAAAEHGRRLNPADFPADWAIRPAAYDARAEFTAVLAEDRLAAWLASLPPPDPAYQPLTEAYKRYRSIAEKGGWPRVPAKSKPGDSGLAVAVAALRARLAAEDPGVAADGDYDDALKAAVARAQVRLGLNDDGVAGATTVAALNVSAQDRVAQIAANLERRRWMPRSPPARRVEVNVAAQSLDLFEPEQPPVSMRIVVGQPTKRTPMFLDHVTAVVLNPPWNVPDEIARKEIWPKIRKDPGYAAREGFVVKAGGGLQQLPGPKCALGAIKFDLGNPYGVYLHDTPAKTLFGKDKRTLSHGCMRVENPNLLANKLLKDDPRWQPDNVAAGLLTGKTIRIPLKDPPTLYVGYWTVVPGADGTMGFRTDAYGWDKALIAKLAAGGKS
jgi:murein L,D-transpeptidase YcbB/YkuD